MLLVLLDEAMIHTVQFSLAICRYNITFLAFRISQFHHFDEVKLDEIHISLILPFILKIA